MTAIPERVEAAYGCLPNGWRLERLKFFADVRNSNVDKTIADDEEPVWLCNYTDVYYNDRITPDLEFMQGSATDAEIEKHQLKRGQVIITKDSEAWNDIAIPALVTEDMPDVLCGYHLSVFEPGAELDSAFLAWLCRSEPLNDQFKLGANGVTRFGLGQYPMKNAYIALPLLEIQRHIARFLDKKTTEIDGLIENKHALFNRLAERRQALLTRAVTKGLNPAASLKPSGIDWLGDIPEHWQTGNIRRFAKMKTGHTPSRSVPEYWLDCVVPWFTLADVWQLRDGTRWYLEETAEKISEIGLANSAAEILPKGTVIFSRTASIGYSGIMPEPMATSQDFWNWICGPKLTPEYLLLLFRSMTQKFEESTNGSTHKTIYQGVAASLEICVPPLREQRAIAAFAMAVASDIDETASKLNDSIDKMVEYRSALITAAVTGQIEDLQ